MKVGAKATGRVSFPYLVPSGIGTGLVECFEKRVKSVLSVDKQTITTQAVSLLCKERKTDKKKNGKDKKNSEREKAKVVCHTSTQKVKQHKESIKRSKK